MAVVDKRWAGTKPKLGWNCHYDDERKMVLEEGKHNSINLRTSFASIRSLEYYGEIQARNTSSVASRSPNRSEIGAVGGGSTGRWHSAYQLSSIHHLNVSMRQMKKSQKITDKLGLRKRDLKC
jgi:hypothetical protein